MSSLTPQTQASYERIKDTALFMPVFLAGPCIASVSVSKLRLAQQLKTLEKAGMIAGADIKILSLQKRGCIGLAVGAILSAPCVVALKAAYDEDKAQQEI